MLMYSDSVDCFQTITHFDVDDCDYEATFPDSPTPTTISPPPVVAGCGWR